jgi:NADH-quinone oxidoreductase subunit M
MLGVFCAMDLLFFYICFEFTLVPLFFLIGIWGGKAKHEAANKFFIYTVAGSVLTFASILYLAWSGYAHGDQVTPDGVGPLVMANLGASATPADVAAAVGELTTPRFSFDIERLYLQGQLGLIPAQVQWWAFLGLIIGFCIKVPLFPVHTWLPLAHTEAPTAGSVILAGVLLKMGTYGFVRFSLPLLPDATVKAVWWIGVLAVIAIIYGALVAMAQKDMKKLVAYSSVSHMGFVMIGMFALNQAGLKGSILQMINHGISTGALFLLVGIVYERRHNRMIAEYGGLAKVMPLYATFFMIITMSSIGLPTLNGFIGEFTILIGAFHHSWVWALFAATGIVLGAGYMLWLYQRVFFGEITNDKNKGLTDLNLREQWTLIPLIILAFWIGLYPKPFFRLMEPTVDRVLARVQVAMPEETAADHVAAIAAPAHHDETVEE